MCSTLAAQPTGRVRHACRQLPKVPGPLAIGTYAGGRAVPYRASPNPVYRCHQTPDTRHGHDREHDREVAHTLISDPASEVTIQAGAVVSKVIHRGDGLNVTVFAFDAGEQLTEHQANRAAVVEVLSGRLLFTVDGEQLDLGRGSWLQMAPGAPHSLTATEPTVMLLTLIGE